MNDLNAVLFYKAKLELAPHDPGADLLWVLVCEIREWMGRKWERNGEHITRDNRDWSAWKNGGRIHSENGRVTFLSACCRGDDGSVNWACRIVEEMPPGSAARRGNGRPSWASGSSPVKRRPST